MQFVHKSIETKSRKFCSVPHCSSYCTKDISLHSFPSDPKLCKTWKTVLKIGKPVTKYMLVCSLHFAENDFTLATNKRRRLKKQAIPSNKIPMASHSVKEAVTNILQRHRLQKCTLNLKEEDMEPAVHDILQGNVTEVLDHNVDSHKEVEKPSVSNKDALASPERFLPNVYEDKTTESEFCEFFEFFELPQILNTDEKLMNFTGINFSTLETIVRCAEKTANFNRCNWPNIRARVILVLCKLKLNISFACLAVLFQLSKILCRNIFYSTVSLLAVSLKPAIYWPTKEEVLSNMPKCFENFSSTRVVLDSTEIKIQKLKCLKCRVMSYSHYKRTHTLKYLIGLTPSGLISFVSAGFGGRATDKSIFNYEKVIDKLSIHDAVMVDKGILIEQECNEKLVKLIRPPFLKNRKQYSQEDAERTADIARARVHIEHSIQRLKNFKILCHQIDWYLIPYADEIMNIIAAIVNLSPPILANNKIMD